MTESPTQAADLDMLDAAGLIQHLKRQSASTVKAWNAWRKRHHYTAVDLHGANLANAGLSSIDLRGANLDGATLNRATLDSAILIRAHLQGARSQKAGLRSILGNWAD